MLVDDNGFWLLCEIAIRSAVVTLRCLLIWGLRSRRTTSRELAGTVAIPIAKIEDLPERHRSSSQPRRALLLCLRSHGVDVDVTWI